MRITLCKSGNFTDFYGTNAEVSKVASVLGRAWSRETEGLRASVTLGVYPDDVDDSLAKLTSAGITYGFAGSSKR